MFGLYEKTLESIVNILKDFKTNFLFLCPLLLGMAAGFIVFGTMFEFLIYNFESYTRYASLGLVIGTLPLLYHETKRKKFKKNYYIIMIVAFILGIGLFASNRNFFPVVTDPTIWQSMLIGVAVAATSIIPGINGAVILTALRTLWCINNICIFAKL